MISNIWNWIKNIFKPEKQDPHLVLYEEVKEVVKEEPQKCGTHNRYKKSCFICRELRQAGVI
jgi:hypothetical protein